MGRPDSRTDERRCPLCGAGLADAQSACARCPLHRGCSLTCCPNCGYTLPESSTVLRWLRRWFGRQHEVRS